MTLQSEEKGDYKRVKQRIKCFSCGKKTVQQNPIEYQQSFYCQKCDIMWQVKVKEYVYQ